MTSRLVLAAAAAALLPAAALAGDINPQVRVSEAKRAGCHVQHVHTPAGKMVHNAPIVRCPETAAYARSAPAKAADQALARTDAPRAGAAASTM